ncbi:hypothetical protein SAMN05444161_0592 [Rhizobiales bacterium GAS191]|jgi:hypothetical protein|nr:hypothetical protein SAMN05519103_08081 [Rhizobiales bacterium GAS113]SEC14517.1 hypothetical protein SAMN05444161_0592 [Rhizobiales bacterium GAS191]SED06314.1 hypothetical protein SAMN05519104_2710 [Rhizobiales bacterium GAS188]
MALMLLAILLAPLPVMLVMAGKGLLSHHEAAPIVRREVLRPTRRHA